MVHGAGLRYAQTVRAHARALRSNEVQLCSPANRSIGFGNGCCVGTLMRLKAEQAPRIPLSPLLCAAPAATSWPSIRSAHWQIEGSAVLASSQEQPGGQKLTGLLPVALGAFRFESRLFFLE